MVCLCVFCGKNLSRPSRLKSHIEAYHTGSDNVAPKKFFKCLYCNKQLSSPQALDRHKIHYHSDKQEGESAEPMVGKSGFTGSMPYIEPPARHVEKLWTEKNGDVEGSKKKKKRKRNWGISRKEYNKKLRLDGKLPSVWEQSTDQKGFGPHSDDEVDEHEDDKGDIFSS